MTQSAPSPAPSSSTREQVLPLTAAQRGIWVAHELDPASPVFNTADAVELTGPVDADVLGSAIRTVLDAAEALHVRVEQQGDGSLVQRVPVERDWPLPVVDLRGEADPAGAAEARMQVDLATPVDLATGPLFATALLRTGKDTWTWYLRIHHLATDAYATALLMRRVAELVSAGERQPADEAPRPLAPLSTLTDADAAFAAGDQRAADRAFWSERLAGHRAPATLAGRTAPAAPGPHRASALIDDATGRALAAAARDAGCAWPELVLAATTASLQALTGERRQVLAMPVLGRPGATRRAPGVAVNVVPLVVEVEPAASLAALTAAVRDELRATRRHHGLRFEELRRLVAGDAALFGPQVNLKPYLRELAFGPATARIRNLATGPVDDLSLIVTDLPGGALELTLDANPALYDAATTRAQLGRLATTLRAAAAPGALDRPVAQLPIATESERRKVLREFNATARAVEPTTLTALLRRQALLTPELIAVADADESITYAELHARAEALAAALVARGAGPDAIVGLALTRSVGLSVTVVATLLAGAAYLPLDPELPAGRLAYVLEGATPACVIATEATVTALPPHPAPALLIDRGGRIASPLEAPVAGAAPAREPEPHHAAYVLYTSGSTGKPKGVVTEHAAIVNRLAWMQHALPIGPGDAVLQKTPYGFDVSVWELLWPLLRGARLVMAPPGTHRDPAELAALIQREGITTAHFVPSMLGLFLEEPEAAACLSLREVVCSGEALRESTVRRFHERLPGAELHNLYGPTEAAIDVTWWHCRPADPPGPVPVGRPIWNLRTYVLDDAGRLLPPGATGELWLAGAGLARGYLGRPDLTAERFLPDPFTEAPGARMYRTGDLARWRADGALDYLGRTDDQVKLRGLRIELGEVEAVLATDPSVAAVAAGVDTRPGSQPRLVAWVVPAAGAEMDPAAVVARAARALPDYMVPAALAVIPELPLSANGKLERRRLPAIAGAADAKAVGGAAPATPREQVLCELFAEVLGVPAVGAGQDLFSLGGDSLLAARLAARIRERLGITLALGSMFAAPTPAALAARIDTGDDPGALGPVLRLRSQGDAPPLFCLPPAGGLGWSYAGLAREITDRPLIALQAPMVRGDAAPSTLAALAEQYATQIEELAPGGPVHLLGWSVGGVLAHEAAAALQARGREVGVLALLDAYPGEQWAGQPAPTPPETLLALLHMGGLSEEALAGAEPTLPLVLAALEREGSALASLGPQTFARVAETVRVSSRMMREHSTAIVEGDLLFVRAAAARREDWLDASAWSRHVTGTVHRLDLDCTHPELPRRGPIDTVGAAVRAALRR